MSRWTVDTPELLSKLQRLGLLGVDNTPVLLSSVMYVNKTPNFTLLHVFYVLVQHKIRLS